MNLMELLNRGGLSLYPLIAFSIIIWAIAMERAFYLWKFSKAYNLLHEQMMNYLKKGNFNEVVTLLQTYPKEISAPHSVLCDLSTALLNKETTLNKMYRKLSETQTALKKGVWILGTIATSAPFVGLFGTVLGIMESFQSIGESGKSGFNVVATGISEALIATAVGIFVAVVAVIFYNIFQTYINRINLDFKNKLEEVSDIVLANNAGK